MINILSRKYFSEWANNANFAANTSDFAEHLKGSVGEKLKMVTRVSAALITVATQAEQFETHNGNILKRLTGSWIQDGFNVGMSCALLRDYTGVLSGNACTVEWTDTILGVSDLELQFSSAIFPVSSPSPGPKTDHALVCVDEFTALKYNYGIIENSAPESFNSPYTEDLQGYYKDGIDVSTTPGALATMITTGGRSASKSWDSGTATVQYIESTDPKGAGVDYAHTYEITQEFIINPVFIEAYIDAFENGSQPEDLIGQKSLKHIAQYEFLTILTNPNTTVRITDTALAGSVGWFGENMNGFNDIYSCQITDYRDTLTDVTCDGLQLKRKTTVSGTITGSGFTNTSRAGFYFWFAAPLGSYGAIQPSYEDTFLNDSIIHTMVAGTVTTTGAKRIKRFKLDYVGATSLTFEADIEFSSDEIDYINPEDLDPVPDKYILGVQVGKKSNNTTETVDNSDKVIMPLAYSEFVTSQDVEGLLEFGPIHFFDHGMTTTDNGHTDYKGWKQDGFAVKTSFDLVKTLDANLKTLVARLIAYNTVTSNEFELQRYVFNLSDIIVVPSTNDYQQLDIDTTRGFKLESSDQFNDVLLSFDVPAGGLQTVNIQFGMKFDWQGWVKLPGADGVFYNAAMDSKGLGKDASRYSMANNYEIRLVIDAGVNQLTDATTRYTGMSPNLDIYNWAEDDGSPAKWTALRQTFDEDDNDTGGIILQNAYTKMKVTWTPMSGSTADFPSQWAVHRIEATLANGYNAIHELSSIWAYPTGNMLIPLSGETGLKITDNGTNIVTECLIDFTKLNGSSYNLSERLGRDIVYPRYSVARDIKFLYQDQSELLYFNCPDTGVALSNSLRHAVLDELGQVVSEEAIALNPAYTYQNWKMQVSYDVITNGRPNFYAVTFTGTATELHEFIFNGLIYVQTRIYTQNIGGSGPTFIRIDTALEPNDKPFIWFGNRDCTVGGFKGFKTAYHDGANWVFGDFTTIDGTPANNDFNHPQDIEFINDYLYIMNYDAPPQADQWNQGKIGVFLQTGGSSVDPVDRSDSSNYTFIYNIYRNSADTENTDGVNPGDDHDLSFSVGFEMIDQHVAELGDVYPIFLVVHDVSLGTNGSRHFSRIYPIVDTPTGPGDWEIKTPMAFTNDSFGAPQALQGTASGTAQSSPLQRKNQSHILIIDPNTFVTGHQSVFYWVKHIMDDWTGAEPNKWHVWEPNDPNYAFNSGNTLHE